MALSPLPQKIKHATLKGVFLGLYRGMEKKMESMVFNVCIMNVILFRFCG